MLGRLALAALTVLTGLTSAARAETLVGGPLYGGASSSGGVVTCRIFNFTNKPVPIQYRRLYNNDGVEVAKFGDSCNVALGARKSCSFSANINGSVAHSCFAVASGTGPRLTGVIEIQVSNEVTFVLPMPSSQ